LDIVSDSLTVIEAVTTLRQKREDTGYIGRPEAELSRVLVARLRARDAETTLQWVKGHSGVEGNEGADALATEGLEKETADEIDMRIPPELKLTGAKLSKITQALAYKAIKLSPKKTKSKTYRRQIARRQTQRMIEKTRQAVEDLTGRAPSTANIWKATAHKDFSRSIRQFMWVCTHNAYRIGEFWEGTKLEQRSTCEQCGVTETMEHILLECQAPGQKTVWKTIKGIWKGKDVPFPRLTVGAIAAAGLLEAKDNDGSKSEGKSRLLRILVSEGAHMVWKLRNERVIPDGVKKAVSKPEIRNRLMKVINGRLRTDQQLASRRYGKKSISPNVVYHTWGGVLHNEQNLPDEWIGESGVLVG
ncbi:hypothetical protein BDZ89DRAFT_911340, partial [Hymenopellis radicata]